MALTIIASNPDFTKSVDTKDFLNIAEFFCDTIQGENFVGYPATFLRMKGCTQNCIFCDSSEVWRFGNPYSFNEVFDLIEQFDLVRKFKEGQHLVLTGGSPLKQQDQLIKFLDLFIEKYGFKPYIEIENEATLMPSSRLEELIDCWNNSPKLENSYNPKDFRYQPKILSKLASLKNSWFKFVVDSEDSWLEIKRDFLDTNLINRSQIVLMPLGATRGELELTKEKTLEIAIRENVRYSTREHIVLWDRKVGV